jgi:hypothetical protein
VWKPLATAVIGGLISATLLTMVVLPALYARFSGTARGPATLPKPMLRWGKPPSEGPCLRSSQIAPVATRTNRGVPRLSF